MLVTVFQDIAVKVPRTPLHSLNLIADVECPTDQPGSADKVQQVKTRSLPEFPKEPQHACSTQLHDKCCIAWNSYMLNNV